MICGRGADVAVIASALQGVVRRRASRFALLAAGTADSPEAVVTGVWWGLKCA